MTSYCDVEFSWPYKNKTDPNRIVEYEVLDNSSPSSSVNKDEPIQFADQIELLNTAQERYCEMNLACKSLYKLAITKLEIFSGFKLIELYDRTEGYLSSVKGQPLPCDNEDGSIIYHIDCPLDVPVRSINGKFVSVGDKDALKVVKLKIYVCSCDNELFSPVEDGAIDVRKLRCFVTELGDQVPENAKSLLDAMEQYKKNKTSTADDIKRQLCAETTGNDQSAAGMTKLMAMFSQLNQSTSSSSSSVDAQNQLLSMLSSVQNGNNSPQMYSFLQNICGRVTDMRTPLPTPTPTPVDIESETNQEEGAASMESKNSNSGMDTEAVNQKLEAMEKQVMDKVDKKINDLEQRLSSKLDLILQGLNIQAPPNS